MEAKAALAVAIVGLWCYFMAAMTARVLKKQAVLKKQPPPQARAKTD